MFVQLVIIKKKIKAYIKAHICFNIKIKKYYWILHQEELFSAIAESVIDLGGVVFGAKYDSGFNVVHSYVDNKKI